MYSPLPDGKVTVVGAVLGQGGSANRTTAVASDGSGFLLAWPVITGLTGWDVRAIRLDAYGNPIGSELTVSSAMAEQQNAAVAWNGQNHLVVWEDGRSRGQDIYGARVTASGVVLASNGLAIAKQLNVRHERPAIVWNGSNHLVAWTESALTNATDSSIPGVRLGVDGQTVDAVPVTLTASAKAIVSTPRLAWDGHDHLLAWTALVDTAHTRLFVRRMAADLQPVDLLEGVLVVERPMGDRSHGLAAAAGRALAMWQTFDVSEGSVRVRAALLMKADPPDAGPVAEPEPDAAPQPPPIDAVVDVTAEAPADGAGGQTGGGCSCGIVPRPSGEGAGLLLVALVLLGARQMGRARRPK